MTIKWVIGILHYQKRLTEKTICMRVCASLYRGRTDVTDNFVINKVSHDQSYNLILSIFSVCTCSPYTPNWFFLEMVCWFLFLLYQLFIQERTTSHKKKKKRKEKKGASLYTTQPICKLLSRKRMFQLIINEYRSLSLKSALCFKLLLRGNRDRL